MAQTNAAKKAASSGPADRLSALPDGALQHILGFLPAHEAVRTSVLAPRWRDLWKSVRRLHIICPVPGESWSDDDNSDGRMYLRDFVNPLFLLRDRASPLEEVKFEYDILVLQEETSIWVRHALMCQVKVLIVDANRTADFRYISLEGRHPVSSNLRKLELNYVSLKDNFLDLSSCPALEVLEICRCQILAKRILSPSVKSLRIDSSYFEIDYRACISVPNVIWLQLSYFDGIAPSLENMPLLETAIVNPRSHVMSCKTNYSQNYCGSCRACCGDDDHKGRCLLLQRLSSAVNLELRSYSASSLIFRRDLIWCPTFSKLKTLSLDEWCVDVDLSPLVCILNHSPVLENLTLYLYKGLKFPTLMEGKKTTIEKPAALSQRLKIIKVVCPDVHDGIYGIIKFLSMWDVEVTIKRSSKIPSRRGAERDGVGPFVF